MKLTSKIALILAFSTVAASPFSSPAMAAAPSEDSTEESSEESSEADAALATESSIPAIAPYERALPGGSFLRCLKPWLVTGYGLVGQCTELWYSGFGWVGRAGFYSPIIGRWAPTTGWVQALTLGCEEFAVGVDLVRGCARLKTDYGRAIYATRYRLFPDGKVRGNWGNYNLDFPGFYGSNDWWPICTGPNC